MTHDRDFHMRRWIKTKASVLCLAWLIIFLHDVIPHNHNDHQGEGCHTLIHATESNEAADGTTRNISHSHHHESSRVCHFSTNLFTKHSLENIAAVLPSVQSPVSDSQPVDFRLNSIVVYSSASLLSGTSLRAPPSLA